MTGGATPEGALFYAASTDGRTFSARVRIPTLGSPKPMHPQILADEAGRVAVAWDEVVGGVRQAAMRSLGNPALGSTLRGRLAAFVEGPPGASVIRTSAP